MDDDNQIEDLEYHEPVDISGFCNKLKEAWRLLEDATFGEMVMTVFNGYNLMELTTEEMEEMLNEFILQNS
jgi:hypothetical protein